MKSRCYVALSVALAGCGGEVRDAPLAELGAQLASNPRVTRSQYNVFACTTCHAVRAADAGTRVLPGAPLQGVARRPSYWGGEVIQLREAVSRCWVTFMRGDDRDLDGPEGRAIGAWLQSISPATSTEGTAAVPMTWPRSVRDLGPPGDRAQGLAVWGRACASCHGAIDTGAGRLGMLVSVLPRDTATEHCDDDLTPTTYTEHQAYLRGIVVEKTRHGSFLGYAGSMPPFSNESLSDDDLRALTALFRCP